MNHVFSSLYLFETRLDYTDLPLIKSAQITPGGKNKTLKLDRSIESLKNFIGMYRHGAVPWLMM